MKAWGIVIAVIGAIIALGSLAMETTIYSPGMPSIGGYGGLNPSQTYNLGLLQRQELIFIGGAALFIVGCTLAAIGQLEATLIKRSSVQSLHQVAPVVDGAADSPTAEAWTAPSYPPDDINYAKWAIGIGLLMVAIIVFFYINAPANSPEAVAIEANADMLADNLEAQADNLEALADTATRTR